jgi:broad specificity phosphatase PhoE
MNTNSPGEERIQTVVFVRHGIAKHNLLDPRTGHRQNLEDPSLFDPPLVLAGKKQALEAGEKLRIWWRTTQLGESIELVVTSSLTRCIQTATLALLRGEFYTQDTREPEFFCTDLIREAFGKHYPDKRRSKSLLASQWPSLKFDSQMTEADELWHPRQRETMHHMANRITTFMNTLVQQSASNIVVVSHGVWIETLFAMLAPEVLDHGKKRVHNCDMFEAKVVSVNGQFSRLQNARKIE